MSSFATAPDAATTQTRLSGRLMIAALTAPSALLPVAASLRESGVADIVLAVAENGNDNSLAVDGETVAAFELDGGDACLLPWFTRPEALRAVAAAAAKNNADACLLLGTNFSALAADDLRTIAHALLTERFAAVVPRYALRQTEGLLNTAILYPLTRALYGRQVRYPAAADMGVSLDLLRRSAAQPAGVVRDRASLLSVEAATASMTLCEADVASRPLQQAEGRDLAAVLEAVAGPVFADMEVKAPLWQRVRGSSPVPQVGQRRQVPNDGEAPEVDLPRMVDNFSLATRNLMEEWGLIMPPTSQVGIKRLSRAQPAEFHFPNDLWARIVYDFALAHRTRAVSRSHLFGALMPLYLGWVTSFLAQPVETASERIEELCKAFEAEKPYLLQRWRWPDRFTP